jgi:peptidoglycan/LPS O-acetylase OafA/YrhL
MSSTTVAVLLLVALGLWHLHNRRRPAWAVSASARGYFDSAYLLVVIAVYWLIEASTTTGWEWAVGNSLLLAAVVSAVLGHNALQAATRRQAMRSHLLESLGDVQPSGSRRLNRPPAAGA